MSAEDLEIHQPVDTPGKNQYLPLKASLGDGLYSILQRGDGILRGRSLPSLIDVSSHPNEEDGADYTPEDDVDATNHKEQEQALIKVVVEQH